MSRFYASENANIHRGVHFLSERATVAYDRVREQVARFLNAASPAEIVFTRGTTEGINLVAQSWGRSQLRAGDEILITGMEHHSNIVPWQLVAAQTGAVVRAVPITDAGELDLAAFDRLLTDRTRLLAVTHLSNALGTINPIRWMVSRARERGAVTLVDGAQSAPHLPVDVRALDCDFFAFSGHKIFGPTGVGVLYGRAELLEAMPPWQGGGDMIETVTLERSTYAPPPARFEAGTPMIAQVIGLGAALDYVEAVGRPAIGAWEEDLLGYATERVARARRRAADRHRAGEGEHPLVRGGGGASARRRRGAGRRRDRHPGGPPLCPAGDAALRAPRHRARLVRVLQHARRRGRPGPRSGAGPERVRLMSSLSELYQNVILEHNRSPRNYRAMPDADRTAEGHNPLCGDQVTVWVRLDGDVIGDVSFQGAGCAISKASASLMTGAVKGKSRSEVDGLFDRFHRLVTGKPPAGRVGNLGQARRVLRSVGVSDPCEVRQPVLAHAQGGTGARAGRRTAGRAVLTLPPKTITSRSPLECRTILPSWPRCARR